MANLLVLSSGLSFLANIFLVFILVLILVVWHVEASKRVYVSRVDLVFVFIWIKSVVSENIVSWDPKSCDFTDLEELALLHHLRPFWQELFLALILVRQILFYLCLLLELWSFVYFNILLRRWGILILIKVTPYGRFGNSSLFFAWHYGFFSKIFGLWRKCIRAVFASCYRGRKLLPLLFLTLRIKRRWSIIIFELLLCRYLFYIFVCQTPYLWHESFSYHFPDEVISTEPLLELFKWDVEVGFTEVVQLMFFNLGLDNLLWI